MRLSEFFPTPNILHDEEFEALGLSNSNVDKRLLSFLDDSRYAKELNDNPHICAVICRADAVPALAEHITGIVLSEKPRQEYFMLHNRLSESAEYRGSGKSTTVAAGCRISPLAYISPQDVEIGEGVVIEEFVSVKGPCRIGANTVIHSGAKVGGDGFEFKMLGDSVLDVAHCGGVEIGDGVIIWENATIHKAVYPWDATRIGEGSRIGANSHIDHGAKIGDFSKICAGAIISGRTEVGSHAYIGPGAVLSNRLHVGESAHAVLGSVVTKDVLPGQTVSGNFAVDHQKHIEAVKKCCD